MSLKLLLWLLVVGWLYHRWTGRKRHPSHLPPRSSVNERPPSAADGGQVAQAETQEMKLCAHCGLYLPRQDALSQGGFWYCSDSHREAGPQPLSRR